jgi:hypothetical protein
MEGIVAANQVTGPHAEDAVLAVSLELSAARWTLRFTTGFREMSAVHTVIAHSADMRLQAFLELIAQRNPLRWKGDTRNWQRVRAVHLNSGPH